LPEWLVEKGIGETRAALVEYGRIIEARIEIDGTRPAGTILEARLVDCGTGGRNGIARDDEGIDYLIPQVPRGIAGGATLNIEVTRPTITGPEPWKRPIAKFTRDESKPPPALAEGLRSTGHDARMLAFPAASDELGSAGWSDLIDEARSGIVRFAGGELRIFATPAMTLIDVDGHLPLDQLAVTGAGQAAAAIRRLDVGGSIGIDLPTVRGKAVRSAAAEAVDSLIPPPFERTAVNGFGFLQVVRPRSRASLVELAQDRAAFETRALLRRLAFDPPGAKRLVAHPAIVALLGRRSAWIDELGRQVGGAITLRSDASLPIHGAYAESA
jgi:hypothetical protein